MATTKNNQKNTNKSTAKKTNSSGSSRSKRKSKSSSDDALKFLLVLVIAGIAIALIFFSQHKGKDTSGVLTGTPTPTIEAGGPSNAPTTQVSKGTITPEAGSTAVPTATKAPVETSAPTATEAPTATLAPTATPTPTTTPTPTATPTPTPTPVLTAEEAETLVKSKVDTSVYSIQLVNASLKVGNGRYYQFGAISGQEFVSPFLVVDMATGELYCYNSTEGTVYDFMPFPEKAEPTATPTPTPAATKQLTAEEAYQVLCTYSKDALQITKEVKEYDAEYGEELTLINGDNCYRINLSEFSNGKVRNRGEFYISADGEKCYYMDYDINEFVLVTE